MRRPKKSAFAATKSLCAEKKGTAGSVNLGQHDYLNRSKSVFLRHERERTSRMFRNQAIKILSAALLTLVPAAVWSQMAPRVGREVRAVWFTTIGGLDWPDGYARNAAGVERQKEQLCAHLDRLKAMGINTVLFQTRIRGTVIYPSAIEPWDGCLSGTPGVSPGYDALQFAVEQCHRRGMNIQAWVVAFPLTNLNVTRQLGKRSIVSRHPELCLKAGDHWMMNPGVPATADYIAKLCAEITRNYDIDGIHLDYIRYPEKEVAFNDARTFRTYGKGKSRAEWRRENITRCVRKIYTAVKALKPWVAVSCSPVGKHDDLPRQFSYGWNARTTVSQDVQQWLADGIMDEIYPMMYFRGQHFYPFALDWIENSHGRTVAPGLGVYFLDKRQKDWDLQTITREINFLRICGAGGQAYFRSKFLEADTKGIAGFLAQWMYNSPVLTPALSWIDSISPTAPGALKVEKSKYEWKVSWEASTDPTPGDTIRYNIYVSERYPVSPDSARLVASRLANRQYTLDMACPANRRLYYAVTATDRFGNESPVAEINRPIGGSVEVSAPAPCLEIGDGKLRLGSLDAKLIIICDAFGREVSIVDYTDSIVDVSRLEPGTYKAYSQGRRGRPHLVSRFAIRPAE